MTKTIAYEVTGHLGDIEFRMYPPLILATVSGTDENEAFTILFRFISGNNQSRKKVPMTAPVITPEKIAMTAPVLSDAHSMSFVMPATYTRKDIPEPLDMRVSIQEVPSRELAVIRFRGNASDRDVSLVRERLLASLARANISPVGTPFLMRYNSPFTPGFLRRNEVGVEIRR